MRSHSLLHELSVHPGSLPLYHLGYYVPAISGILHHDLAIAGIFALCSWKKRLGGPGIASRDTWNKGLFCSWKSRLVFSHSRLVVSRPAYFSSEFPAHSLTPAGDRICAPPRTIFLRELNMFNPREEPGYVGKLEEMIERFGEGGTWKKKKD